MGIQLPSPNRDRAPNFRPISIVAKRLHASKMPLGMEVGLSPGHIVLDRDPSSSPPPKKTGHSPQFSAHVYCGQEAAWIKMLLGMEVGLVRWGHSSPPPKKREHSPQFTAHVCCGQTAVCIRIPLGVRCGPTSPPLKGHSPPIFGTCPLWPNGWMD